MRGLTAPVLAALILATGCASTEPAPYGPATSSRSQGYFEQALELNRYQVGYRSFSVGQSRTGALLRAAELTLRDGADWFQIVDAYTTAKGAGGGGSGATIAIGGSTGGRNSVFGGGVAFPVGGGDPGNGQRVEHVLEVIVGRGDKPNDPDVYDARSVIETSVFS